MLTLDRYLLRLVVVPMVTGLVLLVLLFIVFTAVRLLRSAALGNLPAVDVFALVGAHGLSALEILLPSVCYAALMMTVSAWHREGEAFAVYAGGITPNRVNLPLWGLALIVALCVAALSIYVRPFSYELRYQIKARSTNLDSTTMRGQHFYNWDDGFVIQAQRVQPGEPNLADVFAHVVHPLTHVVITARAGQIDPADADNVQRIRFFDGISYEFGASTDRVTLFDTLEYFAQRPTATAVTKRRARSTAELAGLSGSKQVAEYQWRFAMPLIALFMALTAIELARVKPRNSPYPRYIVALVVYAVTFAGANIAMSAVENESLPRVPGVFAAVLLPFVAFVLARTARFG